MLIIVSTAEPKIVFNSEYCGNSQVLDVFSNYGEFQTAMLVVTCLTYTGGKVGQLVRQLIFEQRHALSVSVLHEWCLTISHFWGGMRL